MSSLGTYFLALYGMTFISDEITRFISGKTPRDPSNIHTIRENLERSCALGIFGDIGFALSSYDPVGYAAGPVPSTMFKAVKTALYGNKPTMAAINLVKDMTPYGNVFYLKAALNYAIWNPLREWQYSGWNEKHYQKVLEQEEKKGGGIWLKKAV